MAPSAPYQGVSVTQPRTAGGFLSAVMPVHTVLHLESQPIGFMVAPSTIILTCPGSGLQRRLCGVAYLFAPAFAFGVPH